MVSQCPHCEVELKLTDAQKAKVESALANLKSGSLKLGCPHCKKAIQLNKDGSLFNQEKPETQAPAAPKTDTRTDSPEIEPPGAPDISWLVSGMYSEDEAVEDVLKVLVLMPEGPSRDAVERAFVGYGYQADFPESKEDAIAQMRFVPFAAVVLHSEFEGDFAKSQFHKYMEEMPMAARRSIFYILVGKEFNTLYDIEALSYSANIVVNESEIEHIDIILKKAMQDFRDLFGPYIEALNNYSS